MFQRVSRRAKVDERRDRGRTSLTIWGTLTSLAKCKRMVNGCRGLVFPSRRSEGSGDWTDDER
jgi:hypothetical protein